MRTLCERVGLWAVILTSMVLPVRAFAADASVEFYVSPSGDDTAPGTEERPFGNLGQARDAIRERTKAGQTANIVVFLRGGIYELKEPLVLGPEDSGTDEFSITYRAYPGEKPIISGGRRITGWKPGPGKIWQAELPEVKAQRWYFRQLFVDGRRATRARFPNTNNVAVIDGFLQSAPSYLPIKDGELKDGIWKVAVGFLQDWNNMPDVEIVVFGYWDIMRKRLESVDEGKGEVILAPPHVSAQQHNPESGGWCFFENAIEMLDQPGEWYLDRSKGILSYWPLDGEDMSKIEAVAPALTQLLEIAGTADQPVRNLHFKGLAFRHVEWPLPPWGFAGRQGGTMHVPANGTGFVGEAVLWRFAESCSFTDCEIAHVGGCGISLHRGCARNLVEGNHVFDIGANGINVGEDLSTLQNNTPGSLPPDSETPRNNRITNNYIHACGADYYGSVGIYIAFTDGTVAAHNLVHDLPYTGISVGMMWGGTPTVCRNNVVEYNHIYDVMKKMGDGAGIYALGIQPGTVIRGNVIHDVRRNSFARGAINVGLYLDSDCSKMLVEGNTVYELAMPGWPCFPVFIGLRSNDLLFRRNVLVSPAGGAAFGYYRSKRSDSRFEEDTIISAEEWKPPVDLQTRAGLEAPYRRALLGQ